MLPALSFRFARNGGQGSIEESEIKNLSPGARGFGVISGRAILHREEAKKHPCTRGAGRSWCPVCDAMRVRHGEGGRKTAEGRGGESGRTYTHPNLGNSLVMAAWPPYVITATGAAKAPSDVVRRKALVYTVSNKRCQYDAARLGASKGSIRSCSAKTSRVNGLHKRCMLHASART